MVSYIKFDNLTQYPNFDTLSMWMSNYLNWSYWLNNSINWHYKSISSKFYNDRRKIQWFSYNSSISYLTTTQYTRKRFSFDITFEQIPVSILMLTYHIWYFSIALHHLLSDTDGLPFNSRKCSSRSGSSDKCVSLWSAFHRS